MTQLFILRRLLFLRCSLISGLISSVELMKKWRGVAENTSPIYVFSWFPPRGVASHRLPCGRRRRRGRCRLVCARSSAYTGPSCPDERTSRAGEDCQSRLDCPLPLSLCLLFSRFFSLSLSVSCCLTKYSPWLTSCSRPTSPNNSHPEVSSTIHKKKENSRKLNWQQAVEGLIWMQCDFQWGFPFLIYLIMYPFPYPKTWGTSRGGSVAGGVQTDFVMSCWLESLFILFTETPAIVRLLKGQLSIAAVHSNP